MSGAKETQEEKGTLGFGVGKVRQKSSEFGSHCHRVNFKNFCLISSRIYLESQILPSVSKMSDLP